MATTKIIPNVLELNPGNPENVLKATNAVTVSNASGSNKYYFDGVYEGKFGLRIGTTVLTGVPSAHPIAIINNGKTSQISYTGTTSAGTGTGPDGNTYTFYYGDITITVSADFGTVSYYCQIHGYMGGQDNLVSVYSEAGLKMPKGTAFPGGETAFEGMMRNDTSQSSESSASTMQHYNGTNWKNFVNKVPCTTSTCNYPTTASALYEFNGNANDTCGSYNGTVYGGVTFSTGKYGQAANFTSNSTYIETSSNPLNFGTSNYTISCWINTTTLGSNQAFISTYNVSGMMLNIVQPNGYIRFYHDGGSGVAMNTSAITTGTWYHVCATMDHSTEAKIYLNGNLENTTTGSNLGTNPGSTLQMGAHTPHGFYYMIGALDQVRIFPTALGQAEVTLLANEVGC